MEIKTVFSEIKTSPDKSIIEGYASIFGGIDDHQDIIMAGSFTKTLNETKSRIKLLWQHDLYEPIGKPINIIEDSKGLYFEAKISNTDVGKKAMILIEDKVLNEMSIGYDTIKADFDRKRNVRILKEIKLYEISVVTLAANDKANITSVKNLMNIVDDIDYMTKSGRVLSTNNISRVKKAIDALNALLQDSEPQEEQSLSTDPVDPVDRLIGASVNDALRTCIKSQESIIDPDILQSLFAEVKKYELKGV